MAIFRRWVREPSLERGGPAACASPADRPGSWARVEPLLLYSFSGFLCGAVLLGVAWRSEFLALVLGISGCLAFLVVVTSRRDELTNLRGDLQARMTRGSAGAAGGQVDMGGHPADRALRLGHGCL